jgi:short-subunit dehydrogenase
MRPRLKPLAEQTIVITGGSSGIGLATARAAAARGAAVVIAARNGEALEKIAAEIRASGGRVATCEADVANETAVERIAETAVTAFGGFDTWVNDAAAATYGEVEKLPLEDHRRVFDVNYFGLVSGSIIAARHLRQRGGGAIINVGSVLSDRAVVMQGAYCASKFAIKGFTDTLRMELEADGAPISVTLIQPAGIHTPYPEHARNQMDQPPRVPPVLYAPELVADAILFAAENRKRALVVGGNGALISFGGKFAPRLMDLATEAFGARAQKAPGQPGDPAMRDNLYAPKKDGQIEGNQDFFVRRTSLWLEAQKRPVVATAIISAVTAAAMIASSRGRRSGSDARPATGAATATAAPRPVRVDAAGSSERAGAAQVDREPALLDA